MEFEIILLESWNSNHLIEIVEFEIIVLRASDQVQLIRSSSRLFTEVLRVPVHCTVYNRVEQFLY